MDRKELQESLKQYNDQLNQINEAIELSKDEAEKDSLLSLQSDLMQLTQLTRESLETLSAKVDEASSSSTINSNVVDDEYALFMEEMAKSGAYDDDKVSKIQETVTEGNISDDSDIEDDLSTLLGMKCAVYHTHRWGGQPTLHNAMVSAVQPRENNSAFKELQVRVLFTQPTHAEMVPCPFFLDGECKFSDEQCRYSHGAIIHLSNLMDAIEPDYSSIKIGSRVLVKLKPPEHEEINLTKKSAEKYYLWHSSIIRSVNEEKQTCLVKLEHGIKTGEKRKSTPDEFYVAIEDVFPLSGETAETEDSIDSDNSLSDTEYPENKTSKSDDNIQDSVIGRSLQTGTSMGQWERHTRGIGSKLMLAMGYVPGTGLGAASDGRVQPVEAKLFPIGKGLDHCLAMFDKTANQDPLKLEKKLKRIQKKEEERNKRAYEREKEKEGKNVFNFLNKTLGNKLDETNQQISNDSTDLKQSTSKDLNIEQFKVTEDLKRLQKEVLKITTSLNKHTDGTAIYKSLNIQLLEKNKELNILQNKEREIIKEQKQRKDKRTMSVF